MPEAVNIGVISDVHGDIDGLTRALALLRKLDVDEIICAGDLVERGGNDKAVIARMRLENIPTVRGNHDHRVPQVYDQMKRDDAYRELMLSVNRGVTELTDDDVAYLSSLPKTRTFTWAGVRVMIAHGTPTHLDTYIFPNALSVALQAVLDNADNADMVILGHTHVPMILQIGARHIVNPGSVHHCYQGSGVDKACAVLSLPAREFTLYDIDTGGRVPLEIITRQL